MVRSPTRCYGPPMTNARALFLALVLSPACSGSDAPADAPADCTSMDPGMDKDMCLHAQIKASSAADIEAVIVAAGQIQDPMIQGAATLDWVRTNVNEVPYERGLALCELLDGHSKGNCQRVLSSPHMKNEQSGG